jgi:hypothetical protein
MRYSMKDFLTTKVAKDTKTGQRVFFLRAAMVKNFRSLRKFFRGWLPFSYECLGLFSRQGAKIRIHFFLCGLRAFARDIPSFGCGSQRACEKHWLHLLSLRHDSRYRKAHTKRTNIRNSLTSVEF